MAQFSAGQELCQGLLPTWSAGGDLRDKFSLLWEKPALRLPPSSQTQTPPPINCSINTFTRLLRDIQQWGRAGRARDTPGGRWGWAQLRLSQCCWHK